MALLFAAGTNRLKAVPEITAKSQILTGVSQLETQLSHLPAGEQIFWLGPRTHRELEAAALAGKRNKVLVSAAIAFHPHKTVFQAAAAQVHSAR